MADITVANEFDLTTTETRWERMCGQFNADVSGRVSTLEPDLVVVRRADFHSSRGNADGPRLRLVIEGAITSAAIGHVSNTYLRTGVDCARAYGQDKGVMDANGKALVEKKNRAEAAAAALSGLFGNR